MRSQLPAAGAVPAPDCLPARDRAGRRLIAVWLALALVVGLEVILYLSLSLSVSADPLLMPLDDTYIHFQYARQFAQGHPLVYNPGDPPTSGATSLLYPPLLAVGWWLGFQGWSLSYWALGIGALCFFGAAWLVYRIGRRSPLDGGRADHAGDAFALALAFALSGPMIWAALSGMESALFLLVVLLACYTVQRGRWRASAGALTLVALTRPEGLLLAALGVVALALRAEWPPARREHTRRALWLALPLLAGLVQPLITFLATGTPTASGMQAKSHLANSSVPLAERLATVAEFWARMWAELLRGRSPDFGIFTSPLLAEVALAGLLIGAVLAWRQRRITLAVLVLAWIAALTAAVATLDTAFWQFKRYQLPVMALFYPAAAWATAALGDRIEQRGLPRLARWLLPALIVIPAGLTVFTFARSYRDNVAVVRDQQVRMARWVAATLPQDARLGVHDVGLLRYFGDRKLYDVVGLTTRGPAPAWRQGPGAIYETMADSPQRPDYFAIYPDVQGLRTLLDAGVFGEVLAEFPVTLPPHNVASAAALQVVYRADWSNTRAAEQVAQPSALAYLDGMVLVDHVDVANLESEAAHHYRWWENGQPPGFVTEVYRLWYRACGLEEPACRATDGERVLTGGESFTLHTHPGEDLLLVTRVLGLSSVTLQVTVNDRRLEDRVQPAVPGRWIDVLSYVPGELIRDSTTEVRIAAQVGDPRQDAYRPAYHWAYQGTFAPPISGQDAVATFGAAGTVRLLDSTVSQQADALDVTLTWEGPAPDTGDGIVFVHLYGDIQREPVAQVVARPQEDTLPPGNWLPGVLQDHYRVPLPADLAPGTYRVAIGLYDAHSGERYPVAGPGADPDRRLFIGEITVDR